MVLGSREEGESLIWREHQGGTSVAKAVEPFLEMMRVVAFGLKQVDKYGAGDPAYDDEDSRRGTLLCALAVALPFVRK